MIKGREKLGRRFSFLGLGVLLAGMIASFIPSWYPPGTPAPNALAGFLQQWWALASLVALPLGFTCATLGSYFINRFARRYWPGSKVMARPDEVLERGMKGFDDKYSYFAHSLKESNYVLAGQCGILIFAARSDRGRVVVQGDRWKEPFSIMRFFTVFAREGVGNPARDLGEQVSKLRDLLNKSGDASLNDVPIDGAAVFLNDGVKLELDSPVIPALRVDQVKEFVRRKAKEAKLSNNTVRVLQDYLREQGTFQEETV